MDIDLVVNEINDNFLKSVETSFGTVKCKSSETKTVSPSWFGPECNKARKKFHSAKYFYKLRNNYSNKLNLKRCSKAYKHVLRKHYTSFKRTNVQKMMDIKDKDPKKCWNFLNGRQNNTVGASLEDLYDFYKNINYDKNENNNVPETVINEGEENEYLNMPITVQEIETVTKNLKNNKASGSDNIVNEHIKSSVNIMMPIYVKLFNIVFETGYVPECWTIGMIKPIYKKKGSVTDPENYRPITLLSCLGKLFTAIINNRLQLFTENIINPCQAGFRKKYSTADNIFVLHTLIQLVNNSKKKLFSAFIDLKRAFDTVWRAGLWSKLLNNRINGKCLKLIQNMYSNIKSCVFVNNTKSDLFTCNIGVRQGENLSPILFSIFLNDLEDYFSENTDGILLKNHIEDDTLISFFKLFCLLYADDTVIFSDSPENLQSSLDIFANYCKEWKLTVNTQKTKVMIFSRGNPKTNYNFTLNSESLEIVSEYKYLGIYFSKGGSFLSTKTHIANQASRAMYSLIKKSKNLLLPINIQIDLFNKLVKPILLYGCKVWGYGNIDVIERV